MRILFVAPVPPPVTGHSLASAVYLRHLAASHDVDLVDLSKRANRGRISRAVEVIHILRGVWKSRRGADAIYLTISESLAGNLKDLLIYAMCWSRLGKMHIHLHGGSIRKLLFDRSALLAAVNRYFVSRLAGIVISGESHRGVFRDMASESRVHVVPNFAQDDLFCEEGHVVRKFEARQPLRVLYISSLQEKKGYNELLDAYLALSDEMQAQVRIDFAGGFYDEDRKDRFLRRIVGLRNVRYHGVVCEEAKRRLFADAHVFCLPTTFLEGQPISILEAYASGCVVVTTPQPGILDVFKNEVNGFVVEPGSSQSIARVIAEIAADGVGLLDIALANRREAGEKYRVATYCSRLARVVVGAGCVTRPLKTCDGRS